MGHALDINGWGRAPAAVAILHVAGSASTLAALLSELDPASTSVVLWDAGVSPAKEAESFDIIQRAGFIPRPCVDGAPLGAGSSYVVPTNRRVWFQGSCLRVSALSAHEQASLDRALQSLARAWGHRSMVVAAEPLRGDGERGVQAVRRVGGEVRVARVAVSERAPTSSPPSERRSEPDAPVSTTAPRSQRPSAPAFRVQRSFPRSPIVLRRLQAAAALAVQRAASRDRVRAWVPACKTGGLVHAVAMLLCEAIADAGTRQRAQVFGTDCDEEALALARTGRYPREVAAGMDARLRALYVLDEDDGSSVRIAKGVREACFFSSHKLPRHAPFCRLDLIVCHRLFEGIAPSQRDDVVSELCGALRERGVLFTLDHVQYFENGCFERAPEGYLQPRHPPPLARSTLAFPRSARPGASSLPAVSADASVPASSSLPPAAISSEGPSSARLSSARLSSALSSPALPSTLAPAHHAEALGLELVDEAIGLPLLVLDDELRAVHVNDAAMQRFGLSPASSRLPLAALAPELPGQRELLHAAERALATASSSELLLSAGARTYLVRLAVPSRAAGRLLAVVFTDVSALEAAADQALLHRHQQAAVARLGELALQPCHVAALCDEALGMLVADIPCCGAGLIVECRRGLSPLGVVASRGLGPEPLATLVAAGADELVRRVLERCGKAYPLERAEVWSVAAATATRSLEHAADCWAPGGALLLEGGAAWPIVSEGVVLGVIALYSARDNINPPELDRFVQGVAHVLAAAIARERERQRHELEANVDAVIGRSADLASLGRGLLHALEASLAAEALDIWCSRHEQGQGWQLLFSEAAPRAGAPAVPSLPLEAAGLLVAYNPPWPLDGCDTGGADGRHARKRPVFRAARGSDRPGELWLWVQGGSGNAAVIRASGAEQRVPERELEAGLEAVALRLAPVIERLRAPGVQRSSEPLRSRTLAELESLCETLPVGISVYDRSGVVRHGLHLSPDPWLDRLYAEALPSWVARAIGTGEPIQELDLSVTRGAERRSWLCSIRPLRDDSGATTGAVAVVHEALGATATAVSTAPATQRQESFIEPRRRRVLILSGEVADANALAALLEPSEYAVAVTAHLDDAASPSLHERLDFVVCDIDSSFIDAAGLRQQLRAEGGAAPPGLIALTRDSGALARVRAEERGFDAYLTLPANRDTLQACMSRLSAAPAIRHRRR